MCDFFCIFAANFNKSDMKKLLILACAAFALLACNQQPASMENQTIQTIMSRVSVREFTGEKISEAQIDTLLRAAMAAPSAINKQPWAFIVVTDEAKIAQLGDSLPYSRCANHPAVAIIPCGDLSKAMKGKAQQYWIQDCSAATRNILLAAHALGLGAVWTGVYPMEERVAAVSQVLQLPERLVPLCTIVIGYPAEQPSPKDKWNPDNVTYHN
jgi:nitroreductase